MILEAVVDAEPLLDLRGSREDDQNADIRCMAASLSVRVNKASQAIKSIWKLRRGNQRSKGV